MLERLKDDPSTLVRRSVANSLNDLGKVHPKLLTRTAGAWLQRASMERRKLIEHALRSALKRGETDALRLLGYGKKGSVTVETLRFAPARVTIGGRVSISFVLRSTSRAAQDLVVDLAVHFVKASGRRSRKVFRVKRVALPPRGTITLSRQVSLAVHTTRVPHPGKHDVEIVVNGAVMRSGAFDVTRGRSGTERRR